MCEVFKGFFFHPCLFLTTKAYLSYESKLYGYFGTKKNQKHSGTYTQTSETFVYLIPSHIGIAKGHVQDWVATSLTPPCLLKQFSIHALFKNK